MKEGVEVGESLGKVGKLGKSLLGDLLAVGENLRELVDDFDEAEDPIHDVSEATLLQN